MTKNRTLAVVTVASVVLAAWAFAPADGARAPRIESRKAAAEPPERTAEPPERGYRAAKARLDGALARLRERAGRRDDDWMALEQLAAGYLERARLTGDWEDYGRARRALDEAFERAPEVGGPWLTRASLDYALHRFDRVEMSLSKIEAYAIPTWDQRRAVREMRANLALQTGHYEEAKKAYAALLEERRSREALVGMAGYEWKTGDLDEADELLAEAERGASGADALSRAWLCLTRGLLALDDGRPEDSLAHYRRGLELMPGWWVLEEHEAEVLAITGERRLALERYRDLIERTGEPELMDAAAGLLEDMGRETEAERLRDRAHRLHEERIARYAEAAYGHAIGHFLEHEGDAERAVEIAEANRDARPNGEAYAQLAEAYRGAGRMEEARHAARHAGRGAHHHSHGLGHAAHHD